MSTNESKIDMPKRIQRKRTKGWRMPDGAVYVGRPTKWQNLAKVGDRKILNGKTTMVTHQMAVDLFIFWLDPELIADAKDELRGKDLACWCPLSSPCHADVLLELANKEEA